MAYDFQPSATENATLGPFQLNDGKSLRDLRGQLAAKCDGQSCNVELRVLPSVGASGLWHTLAAWQNAAGAILGLTCRVSVVGVALPRKDRGEGAKGVHGAKIVSGMLPPDVIQHVVRKSYHKLRSCFEQGLAR
ncbi:MAG: hypothetical protein SFV15_04715 [Polyangiaceae bacterium]|nr:hypothetical protein [Polyangiaceae bacterium]